MERLNASYKSQCFTDYNNFYFLQTQQKWSINMRCQ